VHGRQLEREAAEAEEQRRFEEQEAERLRLEREREEQEAEAQRAAAAQAEADAQESQRQRQAREAQRQRQGEADGQKLEAWLKKNRLASPNTKRVGLFSMKCPLHMAVEENDPEMVRLLLANGADPLAVNSSQQTPLALAERLSGRYMKPGVYDAVLAELRK